MNERIAHTTDDSVHRAGQTVVVPDLALAASIFHDYHLERHQDAGVASANSLYRGDELQHILHRRLRQNAVAEIHNVT